LKQFYPDINNLLIIGSWSYSPGMPSNARRESTKKGWNDAFSRIEELDVEEKNLQEKVEKILFTSTGNWILLCTEHFQVTNAITKRLGLSLVSGCHTSLEPMEEVY
jgi:hypothetical protein